METDNHQTNGGCYNCSQALYWVVFCPPTKLMSIQSCECDLIWKQSLYKYNQIKVRSDWIRTGPNPMTRILKRGSGDRDTPTTEKMATETGRVRVTLLKTKECKEFPTTTRS